MVVVVIILFVISLIVLTCFLFKNWLFTKRIVNNFKYCNVIVFGKKGTGKDLLFNKVINKRKKSYYSNIKYGGSCKVIKLKQVSCEPNTYENFIEDNITKINRSFKEKRDIYISDGGVFLPSQMDTKLHKSYPSMPIFYALSRHLYLNNIHVNVQNLNRLWKALREQADFYVRTMYTKKFLFWTITKCIYYDKYESANNCLLPLKPSLFNKQEKALFKQFESTNGIIRCGFVIQLKHNIHYDTRAFKKLLLK